MLDIGIRSVLRTEVANALIHIAFLGQKRRIGLLGVYALLVVHYPGLAEKVPREELDIESRTSEELLGDRSIQVHSHEEAFSGRLQRDGIGHTIIRVYHRVEAREMTA